MGPNQQCKTTKSTQKWHWCGPSQSSLTLSRRSNVTKTKWSRWHHNPKARPMDGNDLPTIHSQPNFPSHQRSTQNLTFATLQILNKHQCKYPHIHKPNVHPIEIATTTTFCTLTSCWPNTASNKPEHSFPQLHWAGIWYISNAMGKTQTKAVPNINLGQAQSPVLLGLIKLLTLT